MQISSPDFLAPQIEKIPDELKSIKQWVVWRAELRSNGNWTKVPFNARTHQKAKSNDPKTWGSFEIALEAFQGSRKYNGIGFMLSLRDYYVGWDFDHCRYPETGQVEPWVQDAIDKLDSYTEISPSGTGIRIFVKDVKLPPNGRKKGKIEVYESRRYLTVTGHHVEGTPKTINRRQKESLELHASIFNAETPKADDMELLHNSFQGNTGEKLKRLFKGDFSGYPSQSEGDLAFCSHLSKILGGDRERINNIFKQSGLYRQKWDEKHYSDGRTYGEETINTAISGSNQTSMESDSSDPQIETCKKVIDGYGKENFIHADSFTWKWNGKGLWQKIDDLEIKQAIHKVMGRKKITKNNVNSVLDLITTEIYRPDHRFNINQESINCLNGELFWNGKTWDRKSHCREYYKTSQIPVVYDPDARAPRFESFLEQVFVNDPDKTKKIKLVHEAMGYSLLTNCTYEKFFLLLGSGANGKSILMDTVANLAGIENVSAVQPSQFGNQFQRAHLHGKLVNLVTEIPADHVIDDAALKAIVSGELITAEHKHKDPFKFKPYCTCWLGTNHLPKTRDLSEAFFRRAIVIKFNRTFAEDEQDLQLKKKLKQELPGILNLALEGLSRLFEKERFTRVVSSELSKSEWRLQRDSAKTFADDQCVFGIQHEITSSDLYERYTEWVEQMGIGQPLERNPFTTRMVTLGATTSRTTGGVRTLKGITLKERTHNGSDASDAVLNLRY